MRIDIPQELPRRKEIPEESPAGKIERAVPETPLQRRLPLLRQEADKPRPSPQRRERIERKPAPRQPCSRTIDPSDLRRPQRLPVEGNQVALRPEEKRLLTEAGRLRVVRVADIESTIYDGKSRRLEGDLSYLRSKGLIETQRINLRHDGKRRMVERAEVVTLTKEGRSVLLKQGDLPQDQRVYAGLVKPREAEHDSQIYRAWRKESERIEKMGGTNLRVKLDFEIKSELQKAIHAERKANPERDLTEIKQQVAAQHQLPIVDGTIQIPDARIEYDLDQGSRTGHADIEVLTAAYHAGHLRAKSQAGFRNYASSADRATLTAKIEHDHDLIGDILEL